MANYKLALDLKNGDYKQLDWYKPLPISKEDVYKLEKLVEFTTDFKNEDFLKQYLVDNEIITVNDCAHDLCIIYKNNGELKKLVYGISYEESKVFFNEDILRDQIQKLSLDLDFLNALCNQYSECPYQQGNVVDIFNYTESKRHGNEDSYDSIPIIKILMDLVSREIYKYDRNEYTYKRDRTGAYEINFRKLRDLAMFVTQYLVSKGYIVQDNEVPISKDELKDFYETSSIDDERLFEQGFPPNSEELKKYKEYLENLPNEFNVDDKPYIKK